MYKISIVIPLYNSNYIEKQLFSINSLEKNNTDLDIIFVDDWSDYFYKANYIDSFKKNRNLNIVYEDLWFKNWKNRVCKARNRGVELSNWEIIVIIDQETILSKNYLSKVLKSDISEKVIIWPYFWYNNLEKILKEQDIDFFMKNWYINKDNFHDFRLNFYKDKLFQGRIWEFFWGSNFIVKKEIFNKIGWFDETLNKWWDEDVEFWYRLQKTWYKIFFNENLWVLNLSEKLYKHPYRILEENKISDLSENWYNNYEKHKSYEYKRYIFDRFNNLDQNQKLLVSQVFKNGFLNKTNILIHAINWIWLGHIKRTVLIAKELVKLDRIWEIFFVSNSENPFLINEEWFRFEKLDCWIEDTLKDISFNEYEKNNFQKINTIIKENNINIVIHDTYFVKSILENRRDLKHFLILRDSEIDYLESIKNYLPNFKKVFVTHPKEELSQSKIGFLNNLKNVKYTGYVVDKTANILTNNNKIIISPWYWWDYENTKYFFQYVNDLISLNMDLLIWHEIIFVLWKHFVKLKEEIDFYANFKLFDFIPNLTKEIIWCCFFIWRWWYNTLNEIFLGKTKSLLFSVDRFAENQWNRIDFFINYFKLWFLKKWTYVLEKDMKKFRNLFLKNEFDNEINLDAFFWVENIVSEFKKELNKENILVFKHIFLPKSENFIFEELNCFKRINPIVFSLKKEDNFLNSFEVINNEMFDDLLDSDYPRIKNKELYIKFLKYIIFFIKKNNIKVVYTEFLFDAYFIYKLKSIYKNIRIYSAWRWYDVYVFLQNKYINKADFFINIDRIFVRDEKMKQYIWCLWYNNVDIIRSVLRLEKYKFEIKNFDELKILIWWRFTNKKNLLNLLYLIKLLFNKWIVSEIWIVWDWELKLNIISKINELQLSNVVKFYWFLEHKNLINTIKKYNCFINYSKKTNDGDDEGIPNLLLENILSWNLSFSTITGWIWELFCNNHLSCLTWNLKEDFNRILKVFKNKKLIKEIADKNNNKVIALYKEKNSILKLENNLLNNE